MSSTPDAISSVLGRTPSGVFVLTARSTAGQETGALVSWVQQASFAPPMVTVAVNRKRYLHDWLTTSPHLVLNLIGESQKQFLKHFGAGFAPEEAAFDGLHITRSALGLPVLAEAMGHLEGVIRSQMDSGDHVIYAVEILSGGYGPDFSEIRPMVHIRKNGFNY